MRDTDAVSCADKGHNESQSSNDTRDVLARLDMVQRLRRQTSAERARGRLAGDSADAEAARYSRGPFSVETSMRHYK